MPSWPVPPWPTSSQEEGTTCAPPTKTPESIESYLKDHVELAYHPAGTCRMGIDRDAVVTP